MTESELTQILQRAGALGNPSSVLDRKGLMHRLRCDDGRTKRWRVFIRLMLGAALLAGVATATFIGWSLALKDDTHDRSPAPKMGLFREEGAQTP